MTLIELQKILGDRIIAESNNKSLTSEQRANENKITDNIVRIAKQMINNADVILRTDKLCNKNDRIDHIVGEVNGK